MFRSSPRRVFRVSNILGYHSCAPVVGKLRGGTCLTIVSGHSRLTLCRVHPFKCDWTLQSFTLTAPFFPRYGNGSLNRLLYC